jgi:hypothetical protein
MWFAVGPPSSSCVVQRPPKCSTGSTLLYMVSLHGSNRGSLHNLVVKLQVDGGRRYQMWKGSIRRHCKIARRPKAPKTEGKYLKTSRVDGNMQAGGNRYGRARSEGIAGKLENFEGSHSKKSVMTDKNAVGVSQAYFRKASTANGICPAQQPEHFL